MRTLVVVDLSARVPDFEDFEPVRPHWRKLWERLDVDGRRARYDEAVRRRAVLVRIGERAEGSSEREAVRTLSPKVDRSTYRKWKQRFAEHGLEGLVSGRMPPKRELPAEVQAAICTLRRADPDCRVEDIVAHVAKHHQHKTSDTAVKRVLRRAGLNRRRGPPSERARAERTLELAGMKLVEVADVELGYSSTLTRAVVESVAAAPTPDDPPAVDTSGRDDFGRIMAEFNERFRKGPDDAVGPGYASVEQKRRDLVQERLHVAGASREVVERKLVALLVSPLLGSGRWDGIRVPRGDLLGELCGFPYMPSTLDLFTRELKQVGVSNTLWEVHARLWLRQAERWGQPGGMSVAYVDATDKPVWTKLFAQSSKVSSVGRVMPSLEVVSFHLGYGIPYGVRIRLARLTV